MCVLPLARNVARRSLISWRICGEFGVVVLSDVEDLACMSDTSGGCRPNTRL